MSVSCRFEGGRDQKAALDRFTLACAPGTATCLVGPNGAGKSTALALAAGLVPCTTGAIQLGDHRIAVETPPPRLGYLPQISRFPGVLTVREILDFTRRARRADSGPALLATSRLDPMLDRRIAALSSGWVRRLALTVALSPPADLLLLDEPFAGLDLDTLDRLVEYLLRRLDDGAVLLFSSHDFDVVDRLRPQVAVLDDGRLLGMGSTEREGTKAIYRRVMQGAMSSASERKELHAVAV